MYFIIGVRVDISCKEISELGGDKRSMIDSECDQVVMKIAIKVDLLLYTRTYNSIILHIIDYCSLSGPMPSLI